MSLQVVYLPYAVPVTVPKAGGSGGGGSVADIGFDVNPAYSEDHQLLSTETYFYVRLTNSSDAPSGVSLSFSGNILEANTFDTGTAQNPSYVIQPGIGNHKDVILKRGSGSPLGLDGSGNPNSSTCTITYTLADGTSSDYSTNITVESTFFGTYLRTKTNTNPLIEITFSNGDYTNTGTIVIGLPYGTGAGQFDPAGPYDILGTPVASTTESQSLQGYVQGGRVRYYGRYDNFVRISGQSRTWIRILSITDANGIGNSRISFPTITSISTGAHALGSMYGNGGALRLYHSNSGYTALDTSHSHSVNASSSEVSVASSVDLIAVISTWDGSGSLKHYWKSTGHGQGYSYRTVSVTSETTRVMSIHPVGTSNYGYEIADIRTRYVAFLNTALNDSDVEYLFDKLDFT